MRHIILSIAFLFIFLSQFAQNKFYVKVDSVFNQYIQNKSIPGAVLLIQHNGKTIIHKAYGYAQIKDINNQLLSTPVAMTTEHLFDIASLTKVVGTTTSIMLLVDQGLLQVDDPVCKYIPGFNTPEKKNITIRHLLTHTAGLLEWYPMYFRSNNKKHTFALIDSLPLAFPIGAQRKYSDLGFTVLGEIIEKISGQSMEQFMKEKIFDPLGMLHTGYLPNKNQLIAPTSFGNAYEYRMVHDPKLGFVFNEIDPNSWNGWRQYNLYGEVNDGNAWYASGGISGAAGLFSTSEDISHLTTMLQNKGRFQNHQFLSEKTIQQFLTQDTFKNGLGWMMDPSNSFMKNTPEGSFGHTGFTGTSICVIPSSKTTIIILINRQQMGLNEKGEYFNPNPIRAAICQLTQEQFIN
jgi:CubicO group peptidase (beta-lactamase class C family)